MSKQLRNSKALETRAAMAKAPSKIASSDEWIVDPQGEEKQYLLNATSFAFTMMGLSYDCEQLATTIIWGDDNKVYIKDIIPTLASGVCVEGTYEDGKITVELPQVACVEEYEGDFYPYYLSKMEYYEYINEEQNKIYFGYANVEEDNVVVYNVDEEGNITLELNDGDPEDVRTLPDFVLGLCENNTPGVDDWIGFGATYQEFVPMTLTPVTVPEGVEMNEWAMTCTSFNGSALVGFDGDDVYIGNFAEQIDDFVIKGEIQGDKIIVKSGQYIGVFYGYPLYFNIVLWEDATWEDFEVIEEIALNYDAEKGRIATDNELVDFCITFDVDGYEVVDYVDNPTFIHQTESDLCAAPEDPYVVYFEDVEYREWYDINEGYIEWIIPNVNVNGFVLPTEDMYYHFLMNGEVMTLTQEEYPEFDQDYTNIPYDYTDEWDLQTLDESHYFSFRWEGYETFGLQSFFVAPDGEVYASNVVTYIPESDGLKAIDAQEKAIKAVEFYNMQGQKVAKPANGVYLMRTLFEDGTQSVSKIAK